MNVERILQYLYKVVDIIIAYAPKVLLAITVLIIGMKVIHLLEKHVLRRLDKSKIDATIVPFIKSLIEWTLKILLFVSVASMLGVETTSFVAVLGATGLAVGLALQGALTNFAGGILILMIKPYKVGDYVSALGKEGTVLEIQIFNTILQTLQSNKVILPNGQILNTEIINYTALGKRRIDLTIDISYKADIKKARDILLDTMLEDSLILSEPAPFVGVLNLSDSSITLAVHPHCAPDDYWTVYFRTLEKCKIALINGGIEIPFPQMEVRILAE